MGRAVSRRLGSSGRAAGELRSAAPATAVFSGCGGRAWKVVAGFVGMMMVKR